MPKKGWCAVLHAILLSFSVVSNAAFAATYYVTTNGVDLNPGTEANPWRTIQKAANTLQAGDTVYIKVGTFNGKVTPATSGTAGTYITYRNYAGQWKSKIRVITSPFYDF